jgi:hypothetical protein
MTVKNLLSRLLLKIVSVCISSNIHTLKKASSKNLYFGLLNKFMHDKSFGKHRHGQLQI